MKENTTALNSDRALSDPRLPGTKDLIFGPDELGEGFGTHFLEMGRDPDGETPVRCALIRYLPATAEPAEFYQRPAVLFVHGMTDYFFQRHVAEFFHQQGFAVYAIDLRKCGRAWREGQTWHHVTDQATYGEDLTIATSLITRSHASVTVVGHSTGGLNVTMWAARVRRNATDMPESGYVRLHRQIAGVVLNSPWIGLQFDALTMLVVTRVFPILAKFRPATLIPGGINPLYGKTLHVSQRGEWDYNLELKPLAPRPKFVTWLVGVVREIRRFHTGGYPTGVPTVVLCSDTHRFTRRYSPSSHQADLILKPSQMREHAHLASPDVEIAVIPGAMHDVFLSAAPVRANALETTLEWLQRTVVPRHRELMSNRAQ